MKIFFMSFGCDKNLVDSENMIGMLSADNYSFTQDESEADIIIVNTCCFINDAKEESINAILEMAEYKNSKSAKALIVTGCLAKRYKKEIIESMPEVDLCIGVDEYNKIDEILANFLNSKLINHNLEYCNRVISTDYPLAYIRISDGCDNRCSYCAIPLIRGKFRSRKMEDILEEVESLAKQGIKEFCIISQDTSKYGLDIYGKLKLPELLNKISKIEGVKWIRVLYMYIFETSDELITEMANNPKVCKYFDLPIQHISNNILKKMNRYDTKEKIYSAINKIRSLIPDAVIRTTVMVGFPGETKEDYEQLRQGIIDLKFDRLGAFSYSREEGTTSFDFEDQISEEVKSERLKDIFEVQKHISLECNKKRIGHEYEVIVENVSDDEEYFVCRSYAEAPDVDGRIYIKIDEKSADKVIVGEYAKVKIIDCNDYDLFAEVM